MDHSGQQTHEQKRCFGEQCISLTAAAVAYGFAPGCSYGKRGEERI